MFIHFLTRRAGPSAAGSKVLSALTSAGAGRVRPASPAPLRRSNTTVTAERNTRSWSNSTTAPCQGANPGAAPGDRTIRRAPAVQQDLQNPARWGQHLHAVNFAGGNRSKDGEINGSGQRLDDRLHPCSTPAGKGSGLAHRRRGCFGVAPSSRPRLAPSQPGFSLREALGADRSHKPRPARFESVSRDHFKKGRRKKEEGSTKKPLPAFTTANGGACSRGARLPCKQHVAGASPVVSRSMVRGPEVHAKQRWGRRCEGRGGFSVPAKEASRQCLRCGGGRECHFRKCRPVKIRCCL